MTDIPETPMLQDRSSCLKELLEFTENCKKQLNELFETLGWTPDIAHGSTQEVMEVCPYDPNHIVPIRSMERHKATCLLRKMGYSEEEQAAMNAPIFCYDKAGEISSFTMDQHTQQQVIHQARASAPMIRMEGLYSQGDFSKEPPAVPQNHKRQICDLTVADRLALYDHVNREASKRKEQAATNNEDLYVDLVAKLKKGDDQNGPKSHLEKMAEMRDYKRRRQSYRAKNVHITKKSYTEVIREVIDVHSEELSRQWKEEERPEEGDSRYSSQRRRTSEDRRSTSTESRRSYLSSREERGTIRKRHHSPERSREHSTMLSREQSQDRESKKKKKKKRKRDSHSPDEQHDRKKRKKKKDHKK